ncbi:GNAT family N-acetyltransferase [Paractinoplanes atraurantiacus]|uniref:GNAT family N-acetyltransferase n=1 Tax=Paractinoplanes atraurantiacus TaxID=1036182 RepID=UPI0015CF6F4E|nr:GNAT family N-acetyltransferase [Actinoplanes atraurantiacus]
MTIRRFAPGDLADFLAYQGDPAVRRHLPGEPMTSAQATGYLAAQAALDDGARDAWHGFAVELADEKRVIGDLGVWLPARPAKTGDVGFQFHPGFHGRGYAREAMQAFLPYAFETFALKTVTATCHPANSASWGLMERLGMHRVEEAETHVRYALARSGARPVPLRSAGLQP